MKFWTTPSQKTILRAFWKSHQPFTAQDILDQGLSRSIKEAEKILRSMEKKGQLHVIGFFEKKPSYLATTYSLKEWEKLRREAHKLSLFDVGIDEDPFRGKNQYETDQAAQWMIEMIEAKKEEILNRRKNGGNAE